MPCILVSLIYYSIFSVFTNTSHSARMPRKKTSPAGSATCCPCRTSRTTAGHSRTSQVRSALALHGCGQYTSCPRPRVLGQRTLALIVICQPLMIGRKNQKPQDRRTIDPFADLHLNWSWPGGKCNLQKIKKQKKKGPAKDLQWASTTNELDDLASQMLKLGKLGKDVCGRKDSKEV